MMSLSWRRRMGDPTATREMAGDGSRGFCEPLSGAATQRTRLLESSFALVENLRCRGPRAARNLEGFSPAFQVALPYRGLFVWHVGDDDVVGDANQVLFVASGQPFRLSEPLPGGYGELIITPRPALLAELLDTATARLTNHVLFRLRSRRADLRVQFLRACFLHAASARRADPLAAGELVI